MAKQRSTGSRQLLFLEGIARGCSVVEAADYAGVARSTVYAWAEEQGFEERWKDAEGASVRELRRKAYELAMGGNVRLIMFLLEKGEAAAQPATPDADVAEVAGEIRIIGLKEGEKADEFITFVAT